MDWNTAGVGESILCGISLCVSCLIFLLPLRHKNHFPLRVSLCAAALIASESWMYYISVSPERRSIGLLAVLILFSYIVSVLFFFICAKVRGFETWYCGAWALMAFLFIGAVSYVLAGLSGQGGTGWESRVMRLLLFAVFYVTAGLTAARWMPEDGHYQVGPRQMLSAWVLCIMSGTVYIYLYLSRGDRQLNIMLQFYCITILYLQSALFKKSSMKKELDTIQALWHQRKEQYQFSKETIELIDHKCHDLKHQVRAIRAMEDEREREKRLREVEDAVQIYSATVRTGNEILDTILTEKSLVCVSNGIHINCVADKSPLDFMDVVDLYTFFGNALDNAIRAVKSIADEEKRVIDIMICERQSCLIVQIVNPLCGELKFEDGIPLTTKVKNGYHGYGMKSMRHTIQKYGGYLTAEVKDGCFYLKAMVPLGDRKESL